MTVHGNARRGSLPLGLAAAGLALALTGACAPAPTPSAFASPSIPLASPPASAAPPSPTATATGAPPSALPSPIPTEAASATPSPSATPAPVQAGWPYSTTAEIRDALFAPDGSVITVEIAAIAGTVRVVRHLADGSVPTGWPWTPEPTDASMADIALGPDNSVYVIARSGPANDAWREALHRLDSGGREMAGFPMAMPAVSFCGLSVAADGHVLVGCQGEDTHGTLTAVNPDGSVAAGWPVTVRPLTTVVGIRRDGSVLLATQGSGSIKLAMLGANGRALAGFHRRAFADTSVVTMDEVDRIRVVSRVDGQGECAPVLATTYTLLAPDGRTASGWPVRISGWGSGPVVRADGSTVVTTTGHRLLAWSLAGRRLGGWTAAGVDIADACWGASEPVDAGDGGVLVVGSRSVTRFTGGGSIAGGWPVRLPGTVAIECPSCTPGPGAPVDPGVSAGAAYAAVYVGQDHRTVRIVGLSSRGRPIAGFPKQIGKPDDEVAWIRTAPNGRVWALLLADTQGSGYASTLVPITPAG